MKSKIILILAFIIPGFVSCYAQPAAPVAIKTVSPVEFKSQQTKLKGMILDVRTPEEFNEGHIEGAVNMNVNGNDFTAKLKRLDKSVPYFVYCGSGKRSLHAAEIMQKENFPVLYNLDGGITAWERENRSVVK